MATSTTDYADVLTTRTATYLDAVADCLALLPRTLTAYGDPTERAAMVRRLAALESDCDDHLRSLRTTVAHADPNFTGAYLRADDLSELYALVDEIPNAAETVVRDLEAIDAPLDEATLTAFTDVAALAARANPAARRRAPAVRPVARHRRPDAVGHGRRRPDRRHRVPVRRPPPRGHRPGLRRVTDTARAGRPGTGDGA